MNEQSQEVNMVIMIVLQRKRWTILRKRVLVIETYTFVSQWSRYITVSKLMSVIAEMRQVWSGCAASKSNTRLYLTTDWESPSLWIQK